MRKGQVLFTYLHLAASRQCTDALLGSGITSIAYETVQAPDGSLPLLAPMSEVAGRMAPQVGAHHLQRDGGGRGVLMGGVSGVYAAKVVVLGAGRVRDERSRDRARHAGGGPAGGQEHRPAALGRRHLPGAPADGRVEHLRDRARGDRRRPGDRGGARARRQGADADLQRAGGQDEARLGARGHLHRPGRLLRGLAPDHARRADLPGARLGLLLRGQHAGRGAAHLHLRADQRHAAVRAGAGEPGLARGAAVRRRAAARPAHPRGRADHRAGRRGARAALDAHRSRCCADGRGPGQRRRGPGQASRPRSAATSTISRWSGAWPRTPWRPTGGTSPGTPGRCRPGAGPASGR